LITSLRAIPEEDIEALKAAFGEGNLTEASVKVKEALETADKITLNIAVTGESGSGKSSFVNAIRGLKDRDKGATAIGVTETTMKLLDYSHPSYPNVTVWDLPGIGTPTFKPHTYLKEVEFSRYDFFIIISCTRFISHDIQLAQEIQKLGKKFYFVRSKQSNAPTNRPPPYSESAILDVIREDCIKGLKTGGVASPRIFLVTRWDLGKFDFPKLQETLVNELPSHKKLILLRSLSHVSKETLEKKKEQLQTQIWLKSLVSCGIAAVPIPGLSTVCDVAMLVTSLKGFCRDFGLDEKSLSALSKRTKIPIAELKAVIKSPLSEEITKDLVITLLTKCGTGAVQYSTILLKFIPVVGAVHPPAGSSLRLSLSGAGPVLFFCVCTAPSATGLSPEGVLGSPVRQE
uniref:IRG-type G domain-containing protein n=1 Tax=Terrapene triunguis TaxID=2587831 RepID=A0A674J1V0_9SAUR